MTRCKKLQAVNQANGGRCLETKKILEQALWKVVIAYLRRDTATQPLPLRTLRKHLTKITYPADNSIPADVEFPSQHIDVVLFGILLVQGRDDQDYRTPINFSTQKQTGWRQHPAPTFFFAAAEAQTVSVISIIDWAVFTLYEGSSTYRDYSSIVPSPVTPGALPQTPRFSRHKGSFEISDSFRHKAQYIKI